MKKIILILKFTCILIASIKINFSVSAQTAGDFRSITSGNWTDPTKWERYNGNSWVSTTSYPGQNTGTGSVTISNETEITVTATIPNSMASLNISADTNQLLVAGRVTISSANPVSMAIAGDLKIHGALQIANQTGAKTHSLFVGGNFEVGIKIFDLDDYCVPYVFIPGYFQPINQDDKLRVVFNGAGTIDSGPGGIGFQDVTFNGSAFTVITPVFISGNANFVNGIVTPVAAPLSHSADCQYSYSFNGSIFFYDGATVSGASNASFVDGPVWKGGDDPFAFPIGNGNVYAPLTISAPVDPGTSISASYRRSNASDLGSIGDPGIFNVSDCEYWSLYGVDDTHPLNITAGWSAVSGCNSSAYVTNVSDVTLAHFDFNTWKWNSHGGSGVGTSTSGSVTWNGVTTSGPLTLANLGGVCNAPWGSVTNISSNSATISWTAVANSVSYNVDYKPYTSTDWINAATATTSTSVNLSGLIPWLSYDWRIRTNCGSSSSSYRQSQFQTLCGAPSGLTATNVTTNSASLSWLPLANWVNYNVEYKQSTSSTWIVAATSQTMTSYTLTGLTAGTTYNWRVLVNCTVSEHGAYAESSFTTGACYDIYEPNNASSQATALVFGTTIFANISSSSDVDWFKFTVPGSSTINVFLSNQPADYDLYVYNKSFVLVGSSTTTGNESITFNVRGKNVIYYMKVVGKNGVFNPSQCYNLVASVSSGNLRQVSHVSDLTDEVTDVSNSSALYPNPASEFIYVQFSNAHDEATEVDILNSLGQIVKRHAIEVVPGYNQIKIPISDIKPGIYLLRISRGELNVNRKFVIAR